MNQDLIYQICSRCIMDTSDVGIQFDSSGKCDYRNNFDATIAPNWHTDEPGARAFAVLPDNIRAAGKARTSTASSARSITMAR